MFILCDIWIWPEFHASFFDGLVLGHNNILVFVDHFYRLMVPEQVVL